MLLLRHYFNAVARMFDRCAPAKPLESMACMDHIKGIRERHDASLNAMYMSEVRGRCATFQTWPSPFPELKFVSRLALAGGFGRRRQPLDISADEFVGVWPPYRQGAGHNRES